MGRDTLTSCSGRGRGRDAAGRYRRSRSRSLRGEPRSGGSRGGEQGGASPKMDFPLSCGDGTSVCYTCRKNELWPIPRPQSKRLAWDGHSEGVNPLVACFAPDASRAVRPVGARTVKWRR